MIMNYKKYKFIYLIFITIILLFGISCEKKINPDFHFDGKEFLIVDGILTNENINQKIILSKSVSSFNEKPEYVSDAEVSVSNGIRLYSFSEDTTGMYLSDEKFSVVINKHYTLQISFEDKEYTAQARAVPFFSDNSLNYVSYNDTLYHIPNPIAQFNPKEAAMYEVNADWSFVPGYENFPEKGTKAKMFFYVLKTIDVGEIFNPPAEKIYFPKGTQLIVRKYSLSPEHEKFIRSLLLETQWAGGNFDIEKDNIYTNLSKGALGFFGASTVLSDTIIVQ